MFRMESLVSQVRAYVRHVFLTFFCSSRRQLSCQFHALRVLLCNTCVCTVGFRYRLFAGVWNAHCHICTVSCHVSCFTQYVRTYFFHCGRGLDQKMTRYLQRPRRTTASVHVHVCINFSQSMITYVPTDVFIFAQMRSTGAHHRGYGADRYYH